MIRAGFFGFGDTPVGVGPTLTVPCGEEASLASLCCAPAFGRVYRRRIWGTHVAMSFGSTDCSRGSFEDRFLVGTTTALHASVLPVSRCARKPSGEATGQRHFGGNTKMAAGATSGWSEGRVRSEPARLGGLVIRR